MRILYAASEVSPFAKTGGLADVAGALPRALADLGHDIRVILPKYRCVDAARFGLERRGPPLRIEYGGRTIEVIPWVARVPEHPHPNLEVWFVGNDALYDRPGLYQDAGRDYPDNLERFAVFSRAILKFPRAFGWRPELLHANDWQTALSLVGLHQQRPADPDWQRVAGVFTIHNIGYQGLFPGRDFNHLGLPAHYFGIDWLEYYGRISLLKGGILAADALTTVSPTYADEIQTPQYGHGLDGVLRLRGASLVGIINGIDDGIWNPARDPLIPKPYDAADASGKRACKAALQHELGLPASAAPVLGMISRLTIQKGIDLVLQILPELMLLDLQLVVLGSGDEEYHAQLADAQRKYPEKFALRLAFDEGLAHRIEAGVDVCLMPSRYEPCGLNQLYSLRYGTIPIVRRTGGLADTVVDATPSHLANGTATGFVFRDADGAALLTAIRLALAEYRRPPAWAGMMRTAMRSDFSWNRSAQRYSELYQAAAERIGGVRRSGPI